jgi:hypothetical protein
VNRKPNLLLALALCVLAGACGRKIGDQCRDPIDCNNEDIIRTCDQSQPGGYCTVEGCDDKSCPDEAVCMRFFPNMEFLDKACDPDVAGGCEPQDLCVPYPGGGRCAPRSTEKRNCMLRCDDDDDCREEYACRPSGQGSSLALTTNPREVVKYCVVR